MRWRFFADCKIILRRLDAVLEPWCNPIALEASPSSEFDNSVRSMRRPVFGFVGLVVGALGSVAGRSVAVAQSIADRQTIGRFRDSVDAVADEGALKQLEARLMLAAKRDRANPSR